jgi:hypothetical protein
MADYLTETYALSELSSLDNADNAGNGGDLADTADSADTAACIKGKVDGLAALQQAVYMLLQVERSAYEIFSEDYGVDLAGLIGQSKAYVIPELERRLREALLVDERVLGVEDFVFKAESSAISVSFVIKSIYGDLTAETQVSV